MDLIAILKIAVRRWYVVVSVFVITGAVGLVAQQNVPSTYTVDFSIQVTAPYFDTLELQGQFNQNPYSDLNVAGYVANAIATSDQAKESIAQAGGTDQYVSGYSNGSVIPITISGTSAQRTLHTYELLMQVVRSGMAEKQQQLGVPDQLRVRVDEVVQPTGATEVRGDATKVLVAVVGIGVVAAFAAAALLDALLGRHRARGAQGASPPGPPWPVRDEPGGRRATRRTDLIRRAAAGASAGSAGRRGGHRDPAPAPDTGPPAFAPSAPQDTGHPAPGPPIDPPPLGRPLPEAPPIRPQSSAPAPVSTRFTDARLTASPPRSTRPSDSRAPSNGTGAPAGPEADARPGGPAGPPQSW